MSLATSAKRAFLESSHRETQKAVEIIVIATIIPSEIFMLPSSIKKVLINDTNIN